MIYWESNGHVTNDVTVVTWRTWPWKVKVVTTIRLEPVSKTAGDAI